MERLSEKLKSVIDECINAWNQIEEDACNAAIQRLAYYEDLEEQGRLVILPCKFGDPIYRIRRFKRGSNWKKEAVHIMTTTLTMNNVANVLFGDVLGKTVFLAREEAEKALKEDA